MKRTLAVFFLFSCALLHGQNGIDSLRDLLRFQSDDTNKVNLLNRLCKQLWMKGEFYEALKYADTSETLCSTLHDDDGLATEENNRGIIYANQGNYPEALKYFISELKIEKKRNDLKGIADAYGNIGLLEDYIGDYTESITDNREALKIEEQIGDSEGVALTYTNIGLVCFHQGSFAEALKNHFLSFEKATQLNNKYDMAGAANNIGLVYERLNDLPNALKYHRIALQLENEIGDEQGIAQSYVNIGNALSQQKNYSDAMNYLDTAIILSKKIGEKNNLMECYFGKAYIDSVKGDKRSSYFDFRSYMLYKDSLVNDDNTRQTEQAQLQYVFESKIAADSVRNAEIANQEKIKQDARVSQQRFYTYGGIGGFVLMLIVAIISFGAFRNKKKANEIIAHQKELVEVKQKEIIDSIRYAKRIQESLLPSEKYIRSKLKP
ncbi:MAG TPA: tetratricopeptide repeat protein [Bacteroidia bacterium]|jgi:tetratricopeptide (TPR) repeat protein|nr:tetratricopeptide repeat protein [Bacteroidia bacterium]